MSRKSLRNFLEERVGDTELEFIVPHALLPPRYRKLSPGNNLIICLDRNFLIQMRWQNVRSGRRAILSAGEVRRLTSYVVRALRKYRTDLTSFSRFLDRVAEKPPTESDEYHPLPRYATHQSKQ